jgi:hypothetical protein
MVVVVSEVAVKSAGFSSKLAELLVSPNHKLDILGCNELSIM